MLTRNVTCSLRPISGTYRRRIRERYDGPTSLTKESRIALAQAIFEVENDAEHNCRHTVGRQSTGKPADAWAQAFRERSNATSPVRKLAESLIAAGVPEQAAWVRALARGGIHA